MLGFFYFFYFDVCGAEIIFAILNMHIHTYFDFLANSKVFYIKKSNNVAEVFGQINNIETALFFLLFFVYRKMLCW